VTIRPSSTRFRLTNGGRLIGIEATLPAVGKVASILGTPTVLAAFPHDIKPVPRS
jgi:hypothetical protein